MSAESNTQNNKQILFDPTNKNQLNVSKDQRVKDNSKLQICGIN